MASGDTLMVLLPHGSIPPATAYATLDTVPATTATPDISTPVLDFDSSGDEFADWSVVMPRHYAGTTGITLTLYWTSEVTSGTVAWACQIRREENSSAHIAGDFATAVVASADTVEGTARNMNYTELAMTNGAQIDSVVAGEAMTVRVFRDVSADNMASDAELHKVEIQET
jgi:hypothetical protein